MKTININWIALIFLGPFCLMLMIITAIWYPFAWLWIKFDNFAGIMPLSYIWQDQLQNFLIVSR